MDANENGAESGLKGVSTADFDERYSSYSKSLHHPPHGQNDTESKKDADEEKVSLAELYRYADKWDALLMIVGILSAVAAGMALPGLSLVFGEMLDGFICFATTAAAAAAAANGTNFTVCGNAAGASCNFSASNFDLEAEMETAAIRFAIIGFGAWVASYLFVSCLLLTAERQTRRMREAFFRSIMKQEMAWFDTNDSGELATRMSDDLDKVFGGIGDKIGSFIQWMTTFVGGLIVGLIQEWRLALVILSVTPLIAAVAGALTKLVTSFTTKEQKAYAKAGSIAEEVLMLIRTVVAFGGEDKETDRYQVELEGAQKLGNKKAFSSGITMLLTYFIVFGAYSLAFWYGGLLIREHGASGGEVMTTFFAVMLGAFALGYATPNIEAVNIARGAAVRVFAVEDRVSRIDPLSDKGDKPNEEMVKGNIEFKNIHFNYPARPDIKILHGLNLTVKCGETMALVGPSGCGKSTIIQLIQRFYDPDDGDVFLDGHNVRDLNVCWLRKHIGVVSQEPVLFATSIRENIKYGRDDVTDEEIIAATRAANAHDFISELPKRYDTLVGERGAQLSGGQKQRIAIARALVRNPKVLLLDEATSALDTESERTVQDALDKAKEGRTTIVIAHRLSTIRNASTITSIVSGQIVEQGTHAELMDRKDVYYELVMNQQVAGVVEKKEEEEEETIKRSGSKLSRFGSKYRQMVKRKASMKRQSTFFSRQESGGSRRTSEYKEDEEEEEEIAPPSVFRVAKMNAPEWPYFVAGIIGAALAGVIMPVFSIVFAELLEIFSKDCETMESDIKIFAPVFTYIGVGAGIFEFCKIFFLGVTGEALTARLRRLMFRAMLRHEIGWFDNSSHSTGALTTRLAKDASEVKGGLGSRLAAIIQLVFTLLAALIVAFIYNWQMTFVTLAAIPLIIIAGILQTKALAGHAQTSTEMLEEAGKVAVEGIDNIRTVAQLTKEGAFWKRYHDCLEGPYNAAVRKAHLQGLSFGFSQAVIYFAYAGAFRFGGWQIVHQGEEFRNVFIVFGAIVFSAFSVGQAMSFAPDYSTARIAAARVFNLLDDVPTIDSSDQGGIKSEVDGKIEFLAVKFSYPSRPKINVLNGLNISAEPGQTVALVGSSGSGKSTCIQMLERFYDAKEGKLLIDGSDVKAINVRFLRSQLGLVSQEPVLFDCSIAKNIAYGDNSRVVDQKEIEEAARNANIHNFIEKLPKGYDTGVGDKGTQLSGGQKQRIAIARALVRHPKILLLDEATSALDTESEKIVQEALDRAREGRTCIVIAHRLSTIQNADKIIAMRNGQVVEEGTHDELLHKKGFYHMLSQTQGNNAT